MNIDLETIGTRPVAVSEKFSAEQIDLDGEPIEVKDGLSLAGEVARIGSDFEISGRLSGTASLECTRCLSEFESPVDIEFRVVFETSPGDTAADLEVAAADLDAAPIDGASIDLTELVREQLLLNLPAKRLCSEDCCGLCEICGKDLNKGSCDCAGEDIDPRWSALKNLR